MPANRLSHLFALCIVVGFAVLALTYARVTPPFEAADEGAHFLYSHNLLETGELPVILSRETVSAQPKATQRWAIETHQPPLYYAIGAALIFWTDRSDIDTYLRTNDLIFIRGTTADNHNQWLHSLARGENGQTGLALSILRTYSIALAMMTLGFIYLTARLVFAEIPYGAGLSLLTLLLVASIPTFISISASYNNDNLVTMLYTGGVYWTLRTWKRQKITLFDTVILSIILAYVALTKLNGATLFGVVYLAMIVGVWRGYFPRQQAWQVIGISLLMTLIVAGWWYARNFDLYGDPFALQATQSLWGREFEIAETSGDVGAELLRIYRSFWFMVGHLHLPVYASTSFYLYTGGLLILALVGGIFGAVKHHTHDQRLRDSRWLLLLVIGIVILTLLIGTRSVDISYGRLLFPALVGIAPLLMYGLHHIARKLPFAPMLLFLAILPLTITALSAPFTRLAQAYPTITAVDVVPDAINGINATTAGESLTLLAFNLVTDTVSPDESITVDLYLQGTHPANPALFVTVIDPVTLERLGHTEIYPGIAPTDSLETDTLYRVRVVVPVDEINLLLPPRQLGLRFIWHDPNTGTDLPLVDGTGQRIDSLILPASTMIDSRYSAPIPQVEQDAVFGEAIRLGGFSLSADTLNAGDTLTLTLLWDDVNLLDEDYITAVQLVSATGEIITQADGSPAGYPTSAWRDAPTFEDVRTLTIPADAPIGEASLLIGWYHAEDFTRLTINTNGARDNLYRLPPSITIRDE